MGPSARSELVPHLQKYLDLIRVNGGEPPPKEGGVVGWVTEVLVAHLVAPANVGPSVAIVPRPLRTTRPFALQLGWTHPLRRSVAHRDLPATLATIVSGVTFE